MWVQSLGQEDSLEEGMATHSSILAWRIPWTKEPGGLQSIGSQRVGYNWRHRTCSHTFINLSHLSICNFIKKKRNMGAANDKINSSLPWFLLLALAFQMLFFFFYCCLILWGTILVNKWASLVAQLVKNLPAMQGTPVWFLGQEDTLEKGKATLSSPREFHGLYRPWGRKELDTTDQLSLHFRKVPKTGSRQEAKGKYLSV